MLTHKKKALSFILCLTMLLSVVVLFIPGEVALPAEARTIFDIENELNQYKSLLAGIKNEMASIRADIASLRGKSDENIALLEQYRAEIDLLESEIAVNEAVKESYDLKRAQIIAQLTTVQEDYDYRLSLYRNLMQYIYENGDVNTFEMLFSSESFADFLSRRENYNAIMTCANGYMKEIQTTMSDLRVLSDELAETQKEYDEYISALKLAEIEKEEKIQNFNTIAASLGLNIDSLNEQYSQKNARVQEINAKIKTLEEERLKYYNSNAELPHFLYFFSAYEQQSQIREHHHCVEYIRNAPYIAFRKEGRGKGAQRKNRAEHYVCRPAPVREQRYAAARIKAPAHDRSQRENRGEHRQQKPPRPSQQGKKLRAAFAPRADKAYRRDGGNDKGVEKHLEHAPFCLLLRQGAPCR